ncbi:MAG: phage minor head protein [Bacteroidota bacterium]
MLNDEPLLAVVHETNRILTKGLDKGITDNIPPEEMLTALRNDVFVFSGYKTHAQLREVASLLLTSESKIKPFAQFKLDVQSVNQAYNVNYLEAEYIFATSSGEMAAKWNDLEKDSDRYNLQYRTAKDDRVRDTHAAMDGTTLPVEDEFWNSYYPPNGWRCRCTAVQVRKGKYPVDNSAEAIRKGDSATIQLDRKGNNAAAIFRFNPGKQKVIFPPNHPYRQVQDRVKRIVESLSSGITAKNSASSELVTWYKKNLPVKKVGKFEARRFEVNRADLDSPIIVNKVFYNEIRGKYKDDKRYLEKLELSKQAQIFIKNAEFKGDETPIHSHADKFKSYKYNHNGTLIEFKCKVNKDGIFLYYMRLK